jgi:hypothetical protein
VRPAGMAMRPSVAMVKPEMIIPCSCIEPLSWMAPRRGRGFEGPDCATPRLHPLAAQDCGRVVRPDRAASTPPSRDRCHSRRGTCHARRYGKAAFLYAYD